MTVNSLMQEIALEARGWRLEIHQYPELLFDLPRTSALVAEKLREFRCDEVVTGIAKSGVVALIKGNLGDGPTLGLRADMDALPMTEQTNLPYASKIDGMMHACGHDGHSAMLLGAAKYLAATRNFKGNIAVIFQPAEEGGAGGRVMVEEGVLERFNIDEVYGMHNEPGVPVGEFATRSGAIMAAGDRFIITLNGRGGHAAHPNMATDSVLAGAHLVTALQSIASRFTDPFDPIVVSITYFNAGKASALNVIPSSIEIGGTIRSMKMETRKTVEARFRSIVASSAALFDIEAVVDWRPGYPVTYNDPPKTQLALEIAKRVAGEGAVNGDYPAAMGSEDFSYMLEKRPGSMIFLGNGDSAALHNPAFNFNDDAIIHGMHYWITLAEQRADMNA